jgi:hypothetical protein
MTRYNSSIIACGNRNVKDIDLSLDVTYLGAVNPNPEDGETLVPIEQIMNWTVSAMDIDVEITNNEASQYNGHLHVYVTEVNSSYWDDKYGDPYTFAFLDYAFNEDTTITAGGTWSDSTEWDGYDHNNGKGEVFDEIVEENAMVIAAILDEDNDDYVDETVGVRAGVDTEPKSFDVYFGDTNPPPKIVINGTVMEFVIHDGLNWTTEYFWKVDVWDASGKPTYGDIWSFTTRGNDAPNTPSPIYPLNGSTDAPIDTNLTWAGGDPDGDDVTYDVYFGEFDPFNDPPLAQNNHSETTWDPPGELDFQNKYAWKIVAWDEYGLQTNGSKWNFITEENVPPNPAHDPIPPDDETNVPGDAILYWNGSDPNSGDELRYDVYFSINYPPTKQTSNQKETYFDPYGSNDMVLYKEYYWRIVTRDKLGEETSGPDWSFWTGVNHEPTAPVIVGPDEGVAGVEYNYTFVATDPDNHTVMYHVDWGDTNSDYTDYFESGKEVTLSHTWNETGEYTIRARAEDQYGEMGPEGTLHVTMPKTKVLYNSLILRLLERFLHSFPLTRLIYDLFLTKNY